MSNQIAPTRLVTTAAAARKSVVAAQRAGETVGFVPTMGALHKGHLSLVAASLAVCDHTVVSIFVNPTQFGPAEDLDRYPRVLGQDLKLLEELGCWLVFAPSTEEMYPQGSETLVDVGSVAEPFEGARRPGHYQGVATVVLKLLQIIPADRAFFGQKDYQQTLVVKQMVRDLSVPTAIEVCPTVREADQLAMSSRNAYLSDEDRQRALSLWQALQLAEQCYLAGERDVAGITEKMRQHFAVVTGVFVEYIACVEAGTVRPVKTITGPTVIAIAARVGETRLIDNHVIG